MLDATMLVPLHAQIDPAYPENLRTVAELLYVQLVEDAESPPDGDGMSRLALQALRQTERLCVEIGGGQIYLNKGVRYRASLRDREMYDRFNGRNYESLARDFHLSTMRVRQIVDAMHADDITRRQGRLDLA